ncbi:hypothetical protein ACFV5N_03365 [Streptomyces sp. NPDC059853]|uniref:hypothetical protein n=1 Tax=Streptomyces sp. NPDC059853 TaxID=3346973 RepID=UPI003668488E
MGKTEADRLDTTVNGKGLASLDFHETPTDDQLRPFLDGWHPHRREKDKFPAQPAPGSG